VIVLLVAAGAAVGAPARYLVDRAVSRRAGASFPWGTLCVNLVACFVLGMVVGLAPSARVTALVGAGFCGALSTWSTLGYETWRLAEAGSARKALANVLGSTVLGLVVGALGWVLGAAV
jgi:CrcB protein